MTLSKWQKRWNNTKDNKYNKIAPTISKEELKQRALHLKHTSRKEASKIIRLKSGHCMLKSHRSKIDLEITPDCDHCKVKETPSHLLLHCKVFDSELHKLMKTVYEVFNSSKATFKGTMAELLGEHLLKEDQLKEIRRAVIGFITATKKDI